MSEDEDTTAQAIGKLPGRANRARELLAQLTPGEFLQAVLPEIDRRRLNEHGNPTEPPGLYKATVIALIALIDPGGLKDSEDDALQAQRDSAIAERLAAVGDGARLYVKDQDFNGSIRQVAELVETIAEQSTPVDERAAMLAKMLEERFQRPVSVDAIRVALGRPSTNRRLSDVAFAVGLVSGDPNDENDWRPVTGRAGKALK